MLIVGEKINTSKKSIAEAVATRDAPFIIDTARKQVEAGAHYIDVNAGTFLDEEVECLKWLVETVQGEISTPLCLDSPNPKALSAAMEVHQGEPMINSISLEEDRYDAILPVILSRPCHVIALCMSRTSMPVTVEERVEAGAELVERLMEKGVAVERIFVDPLIQPVSVDTQMGVSALGAIEEIMQRFPGINTICGLSNISFGLPCRSLINRNFLTLAMGKGLSAAILDPTDRRIKAALLSSEMLLGKDEFCGNFIEAYQSEDLQC